MHVFVARFLRWRIVPALVAVAALAGCSGYELPPCSSPQVLKLVEQILDESALKLAREIFIDSSGRPGFQFRLENPRMVSYNQDTPLRRCQVDLASELVGEGLAIARHRGLPVRTSVTHIYDVLWLDDGRLWVQVHPRTP